MVVRRALSIAAVIRGVAGACASDTPWRNQRTTNENEIRLCLLELASFALLIVELASLQARNRREFDQKPSHTELKQQTIASISGLGSRLIGPLQHG